MNELDEMPVHRISSSIERMTKMNTYYLASHPTNKMTGSTVSPIIVAIAILCTLYPCAEVFSQDFSSLAGKYINRSKPQEFIILNEDGTFRNFEKGIRLSGKYRVKGDRIYIYTVTMRKSTMKDKNGLGSPP
mgnify:CR=1 FL=1